MKDTNQLKQLFKLGHFGVEIFFIISGIVIPYSMDRGSYRIGNFFTFFKKRLIRIEPPYILCILLTLFLNFLTTKSPVYTGPEFKIDYVQLLAHLGYLNTYIGKDWLNPVFWTLAIEFQYYLFIALIFPLIRSTKWYYSAIVLILFNMLQPYFGREYLFHFSIYFTLGITLYRHLLNRSTQIEALTWLGIIMYIIYTTFDLDAMIISLLTTVVILIPFNANKVGIFLGNISYSLYLLHFIIGLRVINLAQRFTQDENVRELWVLGALIISLFVSYIYYLVIEAPFKSIASRISYFDRDKLINTNEKLEKLKI